MFDYSSPIYSSNGPRLKNRKSIFVTYLYWIIGGYFGLHHFYLKRDRHAFLTWATFGGYFGFGLIHDFFSIPTYVKDYNEDKDYIEKLIETIKKNKKPSYTWYRRISSIAIANVFAYLFQAAIPNKELIIEDLIFKFSYYFFTSLCLSIGIYLVGNIGRIKGSFLSAFKVALITLPVFFIYDRGVLFSSIISTLLFEYYSISWRRYKNTDQSFYKRIILLSFASLIYISLWSSWIYYNCSYVTEEGEEVKCRKLLIDFLNSPSVAEIKQLIRDIKIYIQVYGFSSLIDELFSVLGTQSEEQALKVLLLPKNASSQDISQAYRQLSKKYHPDKQKNSDDKLNAEDKFIEVQKAYRVLLDKGFVSRKLK